MDRTKVPATRASFDQALKAGDKVKIYLLFREYSKFYKEHELKYRGNYNSEDGQFFFAEVRPLMSRIVKDYFYILKKKMDDGWLHSEDRDDMRFLIEYQIQWLTDIKNSLSTHADMANGKRD